MTRSDARWAIGFADLCLLLLGFLLIMHAAPDRRAAAAGVRTAFAGAPPVTLAAGPLFEAGEAVLTPAGRRRVDDLARRAGQADVRLSSIGTDAASTRLDGWELAAARAAAVARALVAAGVAEGRIHLTVDRTEARSQRLVLGFG